MGYLNETTGVVSGRLPSGGLRIIRTVASIKTAGDLPGIREGAMQLCPLLPKVSRLRVVR